MKRPALLTIGISVNMMMIVLVAQQAVALNSLSSVSIFVQPAYAGKEAQWLTFESFGKCHEFVKDNPDLGLEKKDCIKGAPPSPDPE